VAVVVADQSVADAVNNVAAQADTGSASAMKIFTDINEAEAWLARPLDQI
jgi:nitrogen regulatory protein PII